MTFNQPNDRRDFVKTLGASVATSTVSGFLFKTSAAIAQTNQEIITRKIPRTGESLPAIGLGTYLTVDLLPGAPRNHIPEVIKRFWENGARVFDTSPLYGSGEISVGDFASSMAINEQMFICNKIWSTGEFLSDDSHAKRSFERSQQRLWRDKIDLMQVHNLVNVDQIVPVLKNWKKEGKIRYVGVTHHEIPYFPALAGHVERSDLDFV